MKTISIYACYLPGSSTPDYVGSHALNPPEDSPCLQWRYEHCTYLGQGVWIDKQSGAFVSFPAANRQTKWGALLLSLSPQQRLEIHIDQLQEVDTDHRAGAEAAAIRAHQPPYNLCLKAGPDAKRAKWNAYQRAYRPAYLKANPDKAQAKRDKDKARIAAKRAQAKADHQQAQPSPQ